MIEHLGYLAAFIFITMWAISALLDKEWKFGTNYISDLGVSKNKMAALTFNAGFIICGIVFFVYSIWRVNNANDWLIISTFVVAAVMSIFFILIGAIDENKRPYHRYVTYGVFSTALLFLIFLLGLDVKGGHYLLAGSIIAGFAIVLLSRKMKNASWPFTETVGSIVIIALIIIHFIWVLTGDSIV